MVLVNQLGNPLHRLVGTALVIIIVELNFLAQQTALRVDLLERNGVAVLVSLTKSRVAAGQRGDDADLDRIALAALRTPFAASPEKQHRCKKG